MKFTLKEIILMRNKTYNENKKEKYSGLSKKIIEEYDKDIKKKDKEKKKK